MTDVHQALRAFYRDWFSQQHRGRLPQARSKRCWQREGLQGTFAETQSLDSFLDTIWNSCVMCKQQASNKSLIIGWLTLDPWIIYTLGGESEERCRFRAELFSRPPREYFHLSPFTVMIWKQPWQLPQRQMFPCMESEGAESSELHQANEQFSGEGQTFTLSPRSVSSAPGGGCLLLRTPGLNLRQWPEPSLGC